ncbi:hypothetical protein H0H92_005186, partial [Tricholoma furcatifolium]
GWIRSCERPYTDGMIPYRTVRGSEPVSYGRNYTAVTVYGRCAPLQWTSRSDVCLDLFICRSDSKPFPGTAEEEGKIVRGIIDLAKPHFRRCRNISFNVTYSSSLPRLIADFPEPANGLKSLVFHFSVSNGLQGFMQETPSTDFPFPIISELSIDGWNFVDMNINAPSWLELMVQYEPHLICRHLAVSGYRITEVDGKEIRFLINDVLSSVDKFRSFEFNNVEFDALIDDDLSYGDHNHSTISLNGLRPDLTAALVLRETEYLNITRCYLSSMDELPRSDLTLHDIDYPGSESDLRNLLSSWDGYELSVSKCTGFDDTVLEVLTEALPLHTTDTTLRCESLQVLNIKGCHNFSAAELKRMTKARYVIQQVLERSSRGGLTLRLEDVPQLKDKDKEWFRRRFRHYNVSIH